MPFANTNIFILEVSKNNNTFSIYIVCGNPKKGSAYCFDVVNILHKVPENHLWGFEDKERT
jgi:hypothetical protein